MSSAELARLQYTRVIPPASHPRPTITQSNRIAAHPPVGCLTAKHYEENRVNAVLFVFLQKGKKTIVKTEKYFHTGKTVKFRVERNVDNFFLKLNSTAENIYSGGNNAFFEDNNLTVKLLFSLVFHSQNDERRTLANSTFPLYCSIIGANSKLVSHPAFRLMEGFRYES